MKEQIISAYVKRLNDLFKCTIKLFKTNEFDIHTHLISLTAPFIILEKWRERGHVNDIPLLSEAIKNIIIANANIIFGWEKSIYLHQRVALENIFYGAYLLNNARLLSQYNSRGTLPYMKFKDLIYYYDNISPEIKKVSAVFNIRNVSFSLYGDLSKW